MENNRNNMGFLDSYEINKEDGRIIGAKDGFYLTFSEVKDGRIRNISMREITGPTAIIKSDTMLKSARAVDKLRDTLKYITKHFLEDYEKTVKDNHTRNLLSVAFEQTQKLSRFGEFINTMHVMYGFADILNPAEILKAGNELAYIDEEFGTRAFIAEGIVDEEFKNITVDCLREDVSKAEDALKVLDIATILDHSGPIKICFEGDGSVGKTSMVIVKMKEKFDSTLGGQKQSSQHVEDKEDS